MNQRNMRLCLCRSCVGAFFKSNKYRIFRAKPLEVIKEPCDLCRVRLGYDFVIKPQKPASRAVYSVHQATTTATNSLPC